MLRTNNARARSCHRHFRRRQLALAMAAGLCVGTVQAQAGTANDTEAQAGTSAQASADRQPATLGGMTITATRRATAVDKTPMAITAILAETLRDTGAVNVKDYAKRVPGLSVQDSGDGATRLSMRGIYSSGEATTSVYYDETPISGSVGTTSDAGGRNPELNLFDVDRVEALRGPQGTLYGASSMGGSVRVILNKPVLDSFEGSVQGGYAATDGGQPSWQTHAMVNVPLVKDTLALRAAVSRGRKGGYVDNLYYGQRNVNDAETSSGRLMLRYQPLENLTIDASYWGQSADATGSGWSPKAGVRYGSIAQVNAPYDDNTRISNLTLNWDLGWANLLATSSYFDRDSTYNIDLSYRFLNYRNQGRTVPDAYIPSVNNYVGQTTSWSNELRLSSHDNAVVDWTAGVYSENRKNRLFSQFVQADADSGRLSDPKQLFYRRHISDQLEQQAIYGETTWHLAPRLDLATGLRYYDYRRTVGGYTDIAQPLTNAVAAPLTVVDTGQRGWLKKVNLSYAASDTLMVYALVADGMRPRGANQALGLATNLTAYKGDSLWNYEVGAKSHWFDNRLYLSAALYQMDWSDMQISARTANGAQVFLTNAGKARLRGTEWELLYRPLAGLDISANANYIDARLVKDQINNDIQASSTLGVAGDRIPYIPRWTGAFSVAYRWSLSERLDGMARVDANYVGTAYSTFRPTDSLRIATGNYTMVDARVGIESADGKWDGYLYASNLFNKIAIVSAVLVDYAPSGLAYSVAPRTIGVDLRYNF